MQRSLREWTRRERSEHGRVLYGAKDFTNRAVRRSLFVSSNQPSVVSTERAAVSARLSVWAPGYVGAGSHAPLSPRLKASLRGGGPTLPTSRSVSPTSTLSTQTLTSAALGLLPWVLPEPFVSLPPLHLSFHPSSLLSLSFVPRNSCPA